MSRKIAFTILAVLTAASLAQSVRAAESFSPYIVVLKSTVSDPGQVANDHANRCRVRTAFVYRRALKGYAASIPDGGVSCVRSDSRVSFLERDRIMHAVAQTLPWGIDRVDADGSSTQAGNGSGAVTNVHAYIIDTGIDRRQTDLNVVRHVNFAPFQNNTDCNGHGTHVAGTVAAKDNAQDVVGVAPGAPLIGVKVLDCQGSGFTSFIIRGIDWVTANAIKPAVANMSLGGGLSSSLDAAVIASANSGIFYALAAGNDGADACAASPAATGTHDGVMTVAATDINNNEAGFSNFGSCVDVWAPGVNILSTKRRSGTTTLSGTSMASPHVAGTGALYLSTHPDFSASAVEAALKAKAVASSTNSKDGRPIFVDYAGDF